MSERHPEGRVHDHQWPTADGLAVVGRNHVNGMYYWALENGRMWHGPHGFKQEAESDYEDFRARQAVRRARNDAR